MEFDRIRRYNAMGKGDIYGVVNELFERRRKNEERRRTKTEKINGRGESKSNRNN